MQCRATPPQLQTTHIKIHKATLASNAYLECSPTECTSTSTRQVSINSSNVNRILKRKYRSGTDVTLKLCDTATCKQLIEKAKKTITFATSDFPADDVRSYVTQSSASVTTLRHRNPVTFIRTRTGSYNKRDSLAKPTFGILPPTISYALTYRWTVVHGLWCLFSTAILAGPILK